ncbi:MAG: SpoIIE family protein phosphatase [bacterium]|jgi:sigma-B regulation protein RsbU (phosphoserine phosphatase)|nr:SpoIIE family protein phosphatase [bacterium]
MDVERKRILILDDEDEIRENLLDFLEFKGFDVLEAGNGREGLHQLETCEPDLIISDLMMPDMGGLEFLKKLQKQERGIPVVIMTAFGTMQYAIEAMKSGAVDFLTKPLDLPYTLQVINRVVARSEMEKKLKEQQRQLDEDLRHAALIQRCLLPDPIETKAISLHYRFEPLIAIGGDYLTVHKYSKTKLAAALYDVAGHGVSAALTGGMVHNQLQQLLEEGLTPPKVLDALNQRLISRVGQTGMFITIVLAVIDVEAGHMVVANAGHPDLILWKKEADCVERIASHMPPLGMTLHLLGEANQSEVAIDSGDRVIFYSDGFIEATTPEGVMLDKGGFEQILLEHRHCGQLDFIQHIFDSMQAHHQGAPDDDLTLLVVDVKERIQHEE